MLILNFLLALIHEKLGLRDKGIQNQPRLNQN